MKFDVEIPATKESQDTILQGLIEYNTARIGTPNKIEIVISAKDENNKMVGGINGFTHWNYAFVAHLWVHESQRGTGTGSHLIKEFEKQIRSRGCDNCYLDTFSFQAPGFYEKMGYSRFAALEGYPKDAKRFFYHKKL